MTEQGIGHARQFVLLFRIRMATLRRVWVPSVLLSALLPVGMMYFMKLAGIVNPDPAQSMYYVTGNVVLALVFGPVLTLADRLSWSRQQNEFEYYGTLPISTLMLMLSVVAVGSITSIPSVAIVLWCGKRIFGLSFQFGMSAAIISLLAMASMAGLGALIGMWAPNNQIASLLVNGVLGVCMLASPTFIRRDMLHPVLQKTSLVIPTSYAASGLRTALTTGLFPVLDALVLLVFAVSLTAVSLVNMRFRE